MLEAAEFRVASDIGKALTLPAEAFTGPDFLELELRTVFARSWLLVPPVDAALEPRGAYATFSHLDRPLYLQRGWDGQLRCFPNICSHAWFPLVNGAGRERTIVCRQHGRRFDSEDRCLGQPGFDDVREADHLRQLPLAEWRQWLFLAFDKPATTFEEATRELADSTQLLP